jgi:hypothetical protein
LAVANCAAPISEVVELECVSPVGTANLIILVAEPRYRQPPDSFPTIGAAIGRLAWLVASNIPGDRTGLWRHAVG